MPLTELAIKHLKPKDKLYRVTDSNGLCLEVSPTGSKLWRYRFYHLGKPQMTALGKYPTVGLAQARKLRDDARAILETGKHPTPTRGLKSSAGLWKGRIRLSECPAFGWRTCKRA